MNRLFPLLLLFVCLGCSPDPNPVTINGRFVWADSSITGFPEMVKITSANKPNDPKLQEVDSLGRFEVTLPVGTYTLAPQLNYHWMGEDLVRIDDRRSPLDVNLVKDSNQEFIITLDTIPWPLKPVGDGFLTRSGNLDFSEVDDFMHERLAFFEIPGAQLSLIRKGEIIYSQNYGVKKMGTQDSVVSTTLFEAGSITKLVFAFAAMRIYERGLLDLDKPLHEYKEHPEIDDERYKTMTARHVLSHQSGMRNWPRKD